MGIEPTSKTFITSKLIADGKLAIGDGYRAKNSELSEEGVPFARAGNIDGGFNFGDADRFPIADLSKVGDKISKPGDVVFTSKGTVGRLAFVRPETAQFVYSPQLCFWRSLDSNTIHHRWLYYWMSAVEFRTQMLGVKGQTDMADYVSLSDQRRMEITLPHINEQRAIANVLGSLDDKIEQNRRSGAKLEELARAVFKAWFVDFEPVKAKANGATSFPSMSPETFASLPTRLVDSELGPIPEGWRVGSLDDVLLLQRGFDLPKDMRRNGSFPIYAASGVNGWHDDFKVKGPGVTTGRSGVLGQVFFADRDYWPLNTSLWVKEYRRSNPWHAYYLLQTVGLDRFNAGSAVPTLNRNHLSGIVAVLAPPKLLDFFAEICSKMFALKSQMESESAKLATLRDYLLPRLLSGRVRVTQGDLPVVESLRQGS